MAKQQPIVSVVLPCFNAAEHLAATLASVSAQSLREIEILCVDDGSTDATREVIKDAAKGDPRIRLLQHPGGRNEGVSRSRQLGVATAKGELVAFLDADDLFHPTKLERQVEALRPTDALMCHTAIEVIGDWSDERRQKLASFYRKPATYPSNPYPFLEHDDATTSLPIILSSSLVRREALAQIPFGIPQVFQTEDWLLWLLLGEQGKFLYLDDVLTSYRVHAGSYNASVQDNPLKGRYSRQELCLSAMALARTEALRSRMKAELSKALAETAATYGAGGTDAVDVADLEENAWHARALRAEAEARKLRNSFLVRLTRKLRGRS